MATKTKDEPVTDTAVVPANAAQIELRKQQIADAIAAMKSDEWDAEQMLLDIMEANNIDDILSDDVLHIADIIGVPMTIHSAQLQDSKFETSLLPAYAVIRAEFDDGTRALVTCGASQVVAALVAAKAKNLYPFRCTTVSLPTSNGYNVIKLTKVKD